eukprot:1940311-Rhodomonas_salina.3
MLLPGKRKARRHHLLGHCVRYWPTRSIIAFVILTEGPVRCDQRASRTLPLQQLPREGVALGRRLGRRRWYKTSPMSYASAMPSPVLTYAAGGSSWRDGLWNA